MSNITVTMSDIQSIALPQELRKHPHVSRSWFYVFPEALLDLLEQYVGSNRFDPDLLNLERKLARQANAISNCVGFGNGLPVVDNSLVSAPSLTKPDVATDAFLKMCQEAGQHVDDFLEIAQRRFDQLSLPRQGYLGWLWTNSKFRREWDQLSTAHPTLFQNGNAPPLATANGSAFPQLRATKNEDEVQAVAALEVFRSRWRLAQIRGPVTVEPLSVHVPSPLPNLDLRQSQTSGALMYFPDIAPLPDRRELRQLLEDNVRQTANDAEHLQEWIKLVRSDTNVKTPVDKFVRWYSLQHYYRVLYSRHRNSVHNCREKIAVAFSEFLKKSLDTIERDLREIGERLGLDWYVDSDVTA